MSTITTGTQGIILLTTELHEWVEDFIIDRRARGLNPGIILWGNWLYATLAFRVIAVEQFVIRQTNK
jgi:hypothetical protein